MAWRCCACTLVAAVVLACLQWRAAAATSAVYMCCRGRTCTAAGGLRYSVHDGYYIGYYNSACRRRRARRAAAATSSPEGHPERVTSPGGGSPEAGSLLAAAAAAASAAAQMIIDTHAYVFEPWDSTRGYASSAAHLALVKSGIAGHHQPALRIKDGVIGDSAALNREDCDFRLNKRAGRVEWVDTKDSGRRYSKYFSPPALLGLQYTPQALDAEMHYVSAVKPLLLSSSVICNQ
jgi:hypothetical protein